MRFLILFFACCFSFLIPSIGSAAKISPLFTSAFEFGGDNLVNVTYTDGSKSDIQAGRGLLIGGGVTFDLTESQPHTFEVQTTLAIKWTSTKQAKNGTIDWIRFPLDVLGFYKNNELNFRVGGGLTYQFANDLKGSDDASAVSTKFDNSAGFVVAGDYFFGAEKNYSLGLRYTAISYKPQISGASSINGNSFGVSFNYFWL